MTRSKPELGYTPHASRFHFIGGPPNSTPPDPQKLLLRRLDTGASVNQPKEKPMEATEHGDREKHELRAKLEAATEKAKEVCKRLQEETVAAAKATDKAVREHPYQAAGLAFGVGLLIGVLVTRCRRD
jgi:ElaB/YqjD/DUF883 family membrane-anchored ribosome-binding protein